MSNFSKMEQAERWHNKLCTLAEVALYEEDDIDKSEKYTEQAERLEQAITNVRYRKATQADWKIFNSAVSARTLRDAEMAIMKDMQTV